MAVGGYGDFAAGRDRAVVKLPPGQRMRAIVRPDYLIDTLRDPLIVSSLHCYGTNGRVGSSLQSRAPIAKEGVEGSNPFFRSTDSIASSDPRSSLLNEADGIIDLPNYILGVIQQYNHDCR